MDIYPVTIIHARYGGAYEGGLWLAFNCYPEAIPNDATASDMPCGRYWSWVSIMDIPIGRGNTPDTALLDLLQTNAARKQGPFDYTIPDDF